MWGGSSAIATAAAADTTTTSAAVDAVAAAALSADADAAPAERVTRSRRREAAAAALADAPTPYANLSLLFVYCRFDYHLTFSTTRSADEKPIVPAPVITSPFVRARPLDEVSATWKQQRSDLKRDFRKKHKDAVRAKKKALKPQRAQIMLLMVLLVMVGFVRGG